MIYKVKDKKEIAETINSFVSLFSSLSSPDFGFDQYCEKIARSGEVIKYITNDDCVGFCVYYNNDFSSHKAYISLIGVDVKFQGNGIGNQLLQYVKRDSKRLKMQRIELRVNKSNDKAIAFYERNGFHIMGDEIDNNQYLMAMNL